MSDLTGSPFVDIEAMAELDFDRWQADATGWTPPTNEEWSRLANPHLVSVRLAWLTLHKSKDELVAVAEELGDQALMELVSQIGQSADWFNGLHKMLECAETRIMCAYAALTMRNEVDRSEPQDAGEDRRVSAVATQNDTQSATGPTKPALPS